MDTTYYLLLQTFLIFPLLALVIAINFRPKKLFDSFKIAGAFFLIQNILFLFGFSLRDDYVDHFVFSLEYFFFCFIVFSLFKTSNIYIKIFRVFSTIIIVFGFIIGCFGIFLFPFVSQGYQTDMTFNFESNNKQYETRRYSFGGATLSNTRYTFETFRTFKYLPIEYKLDKTDFFDDRTSLNIDDPELKISIVENKNVQQIVFKSSNGKVFSKQIN